jgi:mRNA-degrading endonuclease RelE of RelBE toxin-antitoxin system
MSKDTVIQIRVEPQVRVKLQKMADQDSRKLSDFIRLQLMKLVEPNKKK